MTSKKIKVITFLLLISLLFGNLFITPKIDVYADSVSESWVEVNSQGYDSQGYYFNITLSSGKTLNGYCQDPGVFSCKNGTYSKGDLQELSHEVTKSADGTKEIHTVWVVFYQTTNRNAISLGNARQADLDFLDKVNDLVCGNPAYSGIGYMWNQWFQDALARYGHTSDGEMYAQLEADQKMAEYLSSNFGSGITTINDLKQKINSIPGFTITGDMTNGFTAWMNRQRIKATWEVTLTTPVSIRKTSSRPDAINTYPISDIKFTLYMEDKTTVAKDASGNPAVFTTSTNGTTETLNMLPGKYWIVESNVPDSFTPIESQYITVSMDAENTFSFENVLKPGSGKVKKSY